MNQPEIEYDNEVLRQGLDELDLTSTDIQVPKRLDLIRRQNDQPEYNTNWEGIKARIEKLENLDEGDVSRKTPFIPEYDNLESEVEEYLDELKRKDFDLPGYAGAKLAVKAIEVFEEEQNKNNGFVAFTGVKINEYEGDTNPSQIGSPYGSHMAVELPEWMRHDDWYSEIEGEEDLLAVPVEDPTVFAKHIMDNVRTDENWINSFDDRFWRAYEETIENYIGL